MEKAREALERLQKGVEEVFDSESYKKYLGTMSKFYNYSFGNCMLIYMQKPGASYVAGYNAWKTKFHRTVKKGEKGIQILAPCTGKRTASVEVDGSMEEREQAYTYFRVAYVFDISQTEGEELPSIVSKLTDSVDGYGSLVRKLISASTVPVTFEEIEGTANGFFSSSEGMIVVKDGMPQSQTVKTLIHEIAHSILHDKTEGTQAGVDRRTAEVQAESVAYTVSSYLGIDTSEYSFGYIAGWSSGKEHEELKRSLEVIHDTAVDIIKKLEAE